MPVQIVKAIGPRGKMFVYNSAQGLNNPSIRIYLGPQGALRGAPIFAPIV